MTPDKGIEAVVAIPGSRTGDAAVPPGVAGAKWSVALLLGVG